MSVLWLTSDTHFGHTGICRFLREDGITKVRPWNNPDDMDEAMVELWNDTVRPNDTVYHLGDVVINRKALGILSRLNGKKILIKGNHDIFKLEEYTEYFCDIQAYHSIHNMLLSHIPVHAESKGRFNANIHGHLHERRVKLDGVIDPWYYNVSVEHTEFKPILFDQVLKNIEDQQTV